MAVPSNNAKITLTFTLSTPSGPEDEAQMGVWGSFTAGEPADYDAALADLATHALADWATAVPTSEFSSGASLTGVSAIHYLATGHTANEQRAVPAGTPWTGGQIRGLPWETSLVVSLYSYTPGTFIPNARRRRGRCYLPPLGASILDNNGGGRLPDADALGIMTNFGTWLHDVHGHTLAGGVSFFPGIFSRADSHIYSLTDLAIDGKLDSQRRREKSEQATRQHLAYVP